MYRVLLIEDGPETQLLVRGSVGKWVDLALAPTVAKAMDLIEKNDFDLFLIDVLLPDGDGFQLCNYLRTHEKTHKVPIIFLTSKSDVKDKLMGFTLGGDDYVVKPFEPLELRARIESKLRRIGDMRNSEQVFRCGSLKINLAFQKAYLMEMESERDLDLRPMEFRLLYYFVRHEGHVLSRNQLLGAVWGDAVHVTDRTIDSHVCTLRRKLASCSQYIESIFGEGYRFSFSRKKDQSPESVC